MILGKKPDEEDANYKKMKEWEGQCDKAAAKLQAIGDDISELEKVRLFFLPVHFTASKAAPNIRNQVQVCRSLQNFSARSFSIEWFQ